MQSTRVQIVVFAVTLGAAAVAALFASRGTGYLVGAALWRAEAAPGGVRRRTPTNLSLTKDPTRILTRNIFDAETGPLNLEPTAKDEPKTAASPEPVDLDAERSTSTRCESTELVTGIFYNHRNPAASLVSISSGGAPMVLAVDDTDPKTGLTLLAVRPDSVTIQPTGKSACRLDIFFEDNSEMAPRMTVSRPMPAQPALPAEEPREGSIPAEDYDKGIRKISDTKYQVTRELLDKVLGNNLELMRTARVVPHIEGGRTVGIKLFGIRGKSMLDRIGLANGDMLRTINGYDMSSPNTALEAYARLRSAENLTVSIVRNGRPVDIDYEVR